MRVYVHTKFQASSIIQTSFRQGLILSPDHNLKTDPLKSPPRLGLKMMKNALYFTVKALYSQDIKIFNFFVLTFCSCKKSGLEKKLNLKIYDITICLTNNCNLYIDQYLKKSRQSGNEVWSVSRT